MKQFIYADHAATTPLDDDVFSAMLPYLKNEYGNPSSLYRLGRNAHKTIEESRFVIASCIGAKPNEIFFTSGGTEANNWVIKNIGRLLSSKKVITSEIEHHSVLNSVHILEQEGIDTEYLQPTVTGNIQAECLEKHINMNTSLVSIMYANNEIGTIQNVKKLADIAHSHNALFHTDAVQAIGHIPIDVRALHIDMLSSSAHKFNGPKGIGFLYVKDGVELQPYISGGQQEHLKRAGTENVASIVGMATALKKNVQNIEMNCKYLKNLEDILKKELKALTVNYIFNGSKNRIPGNISISFANVDGEMLLHRLDLLGIAVSTGSACDSKNTRISHVLEAIRLPEKYAKGTVRITFGIENSEDEVIEVAKSLKSILDKK